MGGVDLLDCFISQYRPTIQVKKLCYPLFVSCLIMICEAAWQLYVIIQRDPQKVVVELLRNAVRPETARALKSDLQIANKSI